MDNAITETNRYYNFPKAYEVTAIKRYRMDREDWSVMTNRTIRKQSDKSIGFNTGRSLY